MAYPASRTGNKARHTCGIACSHGIVAFAVVLAAASALIWYVTGVDNTMAPLAEYPNPKKYLEKSDAELKADLDSIDLNNLGADLADIEVELNK